MRIGEATHASPTSQTGQALLTHPAFRLVVWLARPTCSRASPRRAEGLLPQQQTALLWAQFPEPSIGTVLIGPRLLVTGGLALRHSPSHFVRSYAWPFHHLPTPLGSTIITRFSATTGALT